MSEKDKGTNGGAGRVSRAAWGSGSGRAEAAVAPEASSVGRLLGCTGHHLTEAQVLSKPRGSHTTSLTEVWCHGRACKFARDAGIPYGTGWCPNCSTSNVPPASGLGKVAKDGPSLWSPTTDVRDLDEAPSSKCHGAI